MALELNGTTGVSLVQDGVITDANLPAGSVLQVVQGTTSTSATTTGSTYIDTNLSASITPSSADSKVLVVVTQDSAIFGNSTGDTFNAIGLLRDATLLKEAKIGTKNNSATVEAVMSTTGIVYLDSPNTTSSVTYKTQLKATSGTAFVQYSSFNDSQIVLMEIAG